MFCRNLRHVVGEVFSVNSLLFSSAVLSVWTHYLHQRTTGVIQKSPHRVGSFRSAHTVGGSFRSAHTGWEGVIQDSTHCCGSFRSAHTVVGHSGQHTVGGDSVTHSTVSLSHPLQIGGRHDCCRDLVPHQRMEFSPWRNMVGSVKCCTTEISSLAFVSCAL